LRARSHPRARGSARGLRGVRLPLRARPRGVDETADRAGSAPRVRGHHHPRGHHRKSRRELEPDPRAARRGRRRRSQAAARPLLRGGRPGGGGRSARPHARFSDRQPGARDRDTAGGGRLCRACPTPRRPDARRAAAGHAGCGHQRGPTADLQGRRSAARRSAPARLERRPLRASHRADLRVASARGAPVLRARSAPRADRARRRRGPPAPGGALRRSRWRGPRVWIGVAITAVTLWLALRDVSFRDLGRDLARANLLLAVGISVPSYLLVVWLRALRWRYLTDAVCPIERGALFRATAVGFLANNVFPLRIGEVVRAWHLARETQAGVAPLFGTIVLERVVDGLAVVAMALVIFGVRRGHGGVLAVGIPLLLVAILPLGGVLLLRFAPERAVALARGLA